MRHDIMDQGITSVYLVCKQTVSSSTVKEILIY